MKHVHDPPENFKTFVQC